MTTRRPQQYASGIARKAAIMDAAFTAFGRIGYWNTTLLQIAADCGVTRAGLLHHFATKEALLEAVLVRRDELNRQQIFGDAIDPETDPRDFLVRMVQLVDHNVSQPGIVNLFAVLGAEATHRDHPAHNYFRARYENVRVWIQSALATLAGCGELRDGVTPATAAIELTALLDGLQVQWLYDPAGIDMTAIFRDRLNEILRHPIDVPLG